MMWFKRLLIGALAACWGAAALAQGAQFPAGTVWGNDTAAQRPGKVSTLTAMLDRAFGSTRGSILIRGASGWTPLVPGTLGFPFVSAGAGADPLYQRLGLVGGGTNADLSATGGASQFLRQNSAGAAITVIRPVCADLSNASASCSTDATNASNISSGNLNILRFPSIAANTMIANWTASGAVPLANTIPACANDGAHALVYINGTGLQCATISAGSGTVTSVAGAGLAVASPAPIVGAGTITVTAATKAEQETGSSTTTAVTPANQKNNDSAMKAWASIVGSNGALNSSYNVDSAVRNSTGNYTVTFTTDFANAFYGCSAISTSSGTNTVPVLSAKAAGSIVVTTVGITTGTVADPSTVDIVCYGRQ